jgi:Polyketide cyclase / dehydrase and lipid transport
MSQLSCPTAVVNASVDTVWRLLMEPAGWGDVFDMRVLDVDPPGPARSGQEVVGETGPKIFRLKLTFRMLEIDPEDHRLRMDVNLPFGLNVQEEIRCTPLDPSHCRVDYRCGFEFPRGWRGTVMRGLLKGSLDSGPADSLSRLKRAAERRSAG